MTRYCEQLGKDTHRTFRDECFEFVIRNQGSETPQGSKTREPLFPFLFVSACGYKIPDSTDR